MTPFLKPLKTGRKKQSFSHSESKEFMLLPVERVFRRRPSVCGGSSAEDVEDDLEDGSKKEDA